MTPRTYHCPYCFEDFKTSHDEGDDVDMSPDCGHHFTRGEARRGRPDPANQDEVQELKARIEQLEERINDLDAKLSATIDQLPGRSYY